jgi:hypothetical protein
VLVVVGVVVAGVVVAGELVAPLDELEPDDVLAVGTAVPCAYRRIVYRVPSAVFTSVTDLLTVSVSVCEPLAYEPPTTEITAVFDVSDTRSKRPFVAAFGLAVGKIPPVLTDSETPFTEITADVGGGFGGAGGVTGGDEPDEPPEPLPELVPEPLLPEVPEVPELPELPDELPELPPPTKGSFVSKRENDPS